MDPTYPRILKKNFPAHKTIQLKRQIQGFSEKYGESFSQSWERYKELLNQVPHHGYDTHHLVTFSYEGISSERRKFIQMMCNGIFLSNDLDEAMNFYEQLSENSQSLEI